LANDPLRHPDLVRLSRKLRNQFDEVLEAEQHAAEAVRKRSSHLRDRLLEAEDRGETAVVSGSDGQIYRGRVTTVGVDHLVLDDGGERFLALDHIVSASFKD